MMEGEGSICSPWPAMTPSPQLMISLDNKCSSQTTLSLEQSKAKSCPHVQVLASAGNGKQKHEARNRKLKNSLNSLNGENHKDSHEVKVKNSLENSDKYDAPLTIIVNLFLTSDNASIDSKRSPESAGGSTAAAGHNPEDSAAQQLAPQQNSAHVSLSALADVALSSNNVR